MIVRRNGEREGESPRGRPRPRRYITLFPRAARNGEGQAPRAPRCDRVAIKLRVGDGALLQAIVGGAIQSPLGRPEGRL